MKKPWLFKLIVLFIGCFIAVWFYYLLTPAIKVEKGIVYYLKPGISKQEFTAELVQQKIINYPRLFSLYMYSQVIFSKQHARLKTGEYFFPYGGTPASIFKQVTNGTGLFYRSFTIIPGWSFAQLQAELSQTQTLRHLINRLTDQQVMGRLGYANLSSEGEFFPETYYYTRGVADLVILKRAFDLMQSRLQEAWQMRALKLPYKNPYEILIAASLIEKEAYLKDEMPIIAGVLVNRLEKNMLLQFDPTVIYGMGKRYNGKIYKSDLKEDTLYNTYVHKGLPPTPIAFPSSAAIDAVTHPQQHRFLYFVAKGDGSHEFSTTLVDHTKAVTNLQRDHESTTK